MYEELIRRLREEPLNSNKAALPIMDLCIDAATAIENLSHRLDMAQGERDAVTRHMIELEQEVCRLKSRLADYEDTGLEPEEIKVHEAAKYNAGYYHGDEDRCRWIEKELGQIDHLRDLIQAEKEARLVVLPCKVGDKALVKDRSGVLREMRLDAPDIRFICTDEDNFCGATCNRKPDGFCAYRIRNDGSDIGKTVFLAREELELAQKGGDG